MAGMEKHWLNISCMTFSRSLEGHFCSAKPSNLDIKCFCTKWDVFRVVCQVQYACELYRFSYPAILTNIKSFLLQNQGLQHFLSWLILYTTAICSTFFLFLFNTEVCRNQSEKFLQKFFKMLWTSRLILKVFLIDYYWIFLEENISYIFSKMFLNSNIK